MFPPVCSYRSADKIKSEVFAVYRCRMPMEDSLCLMRPTLPSLFLLCWIDMLQICTTTSHSSLAVRRHSLGPGSSLHVEARSWPSYQKETEGTNLTRENHNKFCFFMEEILMESRMFPKVPNMSNLNHGNVYKKMHKTSVRGVKNIDT